MPSAAARNSLASEIAQHQQNLDSALSYLTGRGITRETAERFQLGVVADTGRLSIPYLTPAGPVSVKYRCLQPHDCKSLGHGKYVYDPGAVPRLFNTQTLLTADAVVIVEGELDAVACEQAGIPAVAYPGATTWQKAKHWRWCFDSVSEVVVIADGDEPGRKAAGEVAGSLRQSVGADVSVCTLPDGMDANSFLVEYGEAALLQEVGWL